MISSLDPSAIAFLNNLNRIGDRMERVQRQLSTGFRVARVSDSPPDISTLLVAKANLDATQQIQANLSRFQVETDAAEQTLSTAVRLFDQVSTLGAEGDTSLQTAAGRLILADQIGSLLQQMAGLAAISTEGRYIFSGDSDQQIPYTVDPAQVNPVSSYLGSGATRRAQHPNGTTFPISLTAQEIFDSPDPATNVFGAILTLRDALLSNDDASIQAAVGALPKVAEHLNRELAFYGATQNRIAEATDFSHTLTTQLHAQISALQDADIAAAALELTQAQTQQQAALTARARLPRSTLFDYLG